MKVIKTAFCLGLGSLIIWSCNNNPTKTEGKTSQGHTIEKLTNYPEADKQQLFFRFVEEVSTDSSVVYTAKSIFEEDTVGLKVEVMKNIQPGINNSGQVDADKGFVEGSIKLSSIGAESDNFVKALGKMFKLPTEGKMTSDAVLPTVFSSNKDVVDLSKNGTYSFKLFFENAKGEPAEVFATVDTYRKAFEVTEKDSTFRIQLLSAFEGK